ncbi:peroxiredoxin [Tessaracoccus sp. ZS01]|uniref:peroxiredoxin family protein n=1 Tax=Tessaracoccus sp. ZS01 TaxID=1906324 RepID=UPI00096E85B0|nr:peroxiredoxin family protein [Tessaracoccus sp. ZS01]MCG6567674.1 redoxin [Tessaracoccus sp. ZS01]OMG55746.1 redoxin [Tessaracoccus sp. ZS01]
MTQTKHRPDGLSARARVRAEQQQDQVRAKRNRTIRRALGALVLVVILGVTGYGLWSARPVENATDVVAPDFTLPTTDGQTVSLSALRGGPVILYFNEGAGCASCTAQMREIEKFAGIEEAGITVLPIVMNTAEQIRPDLEYFGVTTPYLLDDGTVSAAYDVLGKGMHEGLPGHGFVLIDPEGVQRWSGDYPSMWLEPSALLDEAERRLNLLK